MSNLPVPTFSSSKFVWDKEYNKLTAEASCLSPASVPFCDRLYDDAMDVGFAIKSEKTGKVERFYLDHSEKDRDGDIQYWVCYPVNQQLDGRVQVLIFND